MYTVVSSGFEQLCIKVNSKTENLYEILSRKPSSLGNSGFCFVLNVDGKLQGVITDSDIRKFVAKYNHLPISVSEVTNSDFLSISRIHDNATLKKEILELLKKRGLKTRLPIRVIPIVDNGYLMGYVDLDQKLAEQETELEKHIVIGLGYVGTTFLVCLAENYSRVVGIDKKNSIVNDLMNGRPHIIEKGLEDILRKNRDKILLDTELSNLHRDFPTQSFIFYVCVQTPLNDSGNEISTSFLEQSFSEILEKMQAGDVVILRSTVPIGFSRKLTELIKEKTGLEAGLDYNLCFAPERTVEGKAIEELQTLPQIIGGYSSECFDRVSRIFHRMGILCLKAITLEEAEICKLASNAYRDYIFAFSNYLSLLCVKFGVDVHNLIKISNFGYPRNNFPKPSPGVGGPCLSKDSFMLPNFIFGCESPVYQARRLNEVMPQILTRLILEEISRLNIKKISVGVVGLAFKGLPETSDTRSSPSLDFIQELSEFSPKIDVKVWDAVLDRNSFPAMGLKLIDDKVNIFLILNNHPSNLDYVVEYASTIGNVKVEYIFDPWDLIRESGRQTFFENLGVEISQMSSFSSKLQW